MTFTDKLHEWGPMTVLMIIAAIIAMGVGGAVVLLNPETLTFRQYLDDLKTFALAIAGLAGARGVLGAGKTLADAKVQGAALASPTHPLPPDIVHANPPPGELGLVMEEELLSDEEEFVREQDLPTDEEEFAALDEMLVEEAAVDYPGGDDVDYDTGAMIAPDRPQDGES